MDNEDPYWMSDSIVKKYTDKWAKLLDDSEFGNHKTKMMEAFLEQTYKSIEQTKLPPWYENAMKLIKSPSYYNPFYSPYSAGFISVQPISTMPLSFYFDLIYKNKEAAKDQKPEAPKSLLAPDCIPCGGEGGRHKLGCPVNKKHG